MASDPLFLPGQRLPAGDLNAMSPDPVAFTPSWTNVTVGSPGETNQGYYWTIGREVNWVVELILGTGGDVTGTIEIDWPSGAPAADMTLAQLMVSSWWGSISTTSRHAGTGVGGSATRMVNRIAGASTSSGWSAAQPGDWVAGSVLRGQGSYIAA